MVELFNEMKTDVVYNTPVSIDLKADYAMKPFEDLFLKYSVESKDVVYLINRYSDVIKASTELTDEEKDWIMSGLATVLYSFNYWDSTFKK